MSGEVYMESENIIVLNDDEGNEIEFEFLDIIPYRGKEYVVLLPTSDEADEVVILQLEEADDETESYISVDNELTLQAVFEIFKEKAIRHFFCTIKINQFNFYIFVSTFNIIIFS